jgi:hydroxymethylpyrimidine kinase/phosphomethylpyrimidine kinase/thiamine-phosphate diphosphorylase
VAVYPRKPLVWSIAGSDSGGGAGIQADLLSFYDFGVHGATVITALTAQNSFAVGHVAVSDRRTVAAQINALDSDLPADVIKLGMLAETDVVEIVCNYLDDYRGPVICDPVVTSSSGGTLLSGDGGRLVRERLLPRADLITPNRAEAAVLLDRPVGADPAAMVDAVEGLLATGARAVLLTGGHFEPQAGRRLDYYSDGRNHCWLSGPDIDTVHTHGTGCTLSSAIAAALARGYGMVDALVLARHYVTQGLRSAVQLGGGPGPVAHTGWPRQLVDFPFLQREPTAPALSFADCGGELGLYPVVDSAEWVERLLPLGVSTIQLRIKRAEPAQLAAEIARAVACARRFNARLFINDHWRLAIELGAYGVHLGQEDLLTADLAAIAGAGLRLGISTHSYAEIATAHALGPSYIALGPIYATTTKAMTAAPQGLEQLARWVDLLGGAYPLTAIGGIDLERVGGVLATGVGSCAVVRAITEAADPEAAVHRLLAAHAARLR